MSISLGRLFPLIKIWKFSPNFLRVLTAANIMWKIKQLSKKISESLGTRWTIKPECEIQTLHLKSGFRHGCWPWSSRNNELTNCQKSDRSQTSFSRTSPPELSCDFFVNFRNCYISYLLSISSDVRKMCACGVRGEAVQSALTNFVYMVNMLWRKKKKKKTVNRCLYRRN